MKKCHSKCFLRVGEEEDIYGKDGLTRNYQGGYEGGYVYSM